MRAATILRIALGVLLLATGGAKLLDIQGFAAVVASYRMLLPEIVPVAAWTVVASELALAAWLLSGRHAARAGLAAAGLHSVYLAWSVVGIRRGLVLENCGCFGAFWPRPLGWRTVIEDGVLIAASLALAILAAAGRPALAAEIEGVRVPETWPYADRVLHLNGAGTRQVSLLGIPVYVAALYLPRHETDADMILASSRPAVVFVHALRGAPADNVREAWRRSFAANCDACGVAFERFVAAQSAVAQGDRQVFAIERDALAYTVGGTTERFAEPGLARLVLSTFIGRSPPTEALKRALLGLR